MTRLEKIAAITEDKRFGNVTRTAFKKGHPSYTKSGAEHPGYKHGLGSTRLRDPLYSSWARMKRRCYNKNAWREYPRYGGKGITVCDRWLDFSNFLEDMGAGYKKGLSLDRIDNNKGYSPENCRWVTLAEQNKNKSTVRTYSYKGKMRTIPEIAALVGIKHATLYARIRKAEQTTPKGIDFIYSLIEKTV